MNRPGDELRHTTECPHSPANGTGPPHRGPGSPPAECGHSPRPPPPTAPPWACITSSPPHLPGRASRRHPPHFADECRPRPTRAGTQHLPPSTRPVRSGHSTRPSGSRPPRPSSPACPSVHACPTCGGHSAHQSLKAGHPLGVCRHSAHAPPHAEPPPILRERPARPPPHAEDPCGRCERSARPPSSDVRPVTKGTWPVRCSCGPAALHTGAGLRATVAGGAGIGRREGRVASRSGPPPPATSPGDSPPRTRVTPSQRRPRRHEVPDASSGRTLPRVRTRARPSRPHPQRRPFLSRARE